MTDREMLLMVYGSLRAIKTAPPELVRQLEKHLFEGADKKPGTPPDTTHPKTR